MLNRSTVKHRDTLPPDRLLSRAIAACLLLSLVVPAWAGGTTNTATLLRTRVSNSTRHFRQTLPYDQLGTDNLLDLRVGLRGFVDLHTHPMGHLGFGGMAMHGVPDINLIFAQCGHLLVARAPEQALGSCNPVHGGWGIDNGCGDYLRAAMINHMIDDDFIFKTSNVHGDHVHDGFPNFPAWPHQTSILHQQMWWEWIRRAHAGGLRVLVALAVNSELLTALLGGTSDDRSSAELQIDQTIVMVQQHDFMEVARTPVELNRIVAGGKLAVVLGVEVDRIGNFVNPSTAQVDAEIRRLYKKGIRYVFPIHLIDNAFGGAAVYDPMLSFANKRANGHHFTVVHSQDPRVVYNASDGVVSHINMLGNFLEFIGDLPAPCFCPFPAVSCCGTYRQVEALFQSSPEVSAYATVPPGHVNARGLSEMGEHALRTMMRYGMLIDVDHMSEKSMRRAVYLAGRHEGGAYPLIMGHTGVRAENSTERMAPPDLMREVADAGGMIGLGTADTTPEAFIYSHGRVKEVVGAASVAIGTDANGFERLPRNQESCESGSNIQESDAFYKNFMSDTNIQKSRLGNRVWDYVMDCGVSHYGLMAEFMYDVKQKPGGQAVYDDLMNSADKFARLWSKVDKIRGAAGGLCSSAGTCPHVQANSPSGAQYCDTSVEPPLCRPAECVSDEDCAGPSHCVGTGEDAHCSDPGEPPLDCSGVDFACLIGFEAMGSVCATSGVDPPRGEPLPEGEDPCPTGRRHPASVQERACLSGVRERPKRGVKVFCRP